MAIECCIVFYIEKGDNYLITIDDINSSPSNHWSLSELSHNRILALFIPFQVPLNIDSKDHKVQKSVIRSQNINTKYVLIPYSDSKIQ